MKRAKIEYDHQKVESWNREEHMPELNLVGVKIGGTWYPALPPKAYGSDGLTPRDRKWMYPARKAPRVVPDLGPRPSKGFQSPPWQAPPLSDPHQIGPRMVRSTAAELFKRGLPRQLQPLVTVGSMALDWLEPPAPYALAPVNLVPTESIPGADGFDYHVQYTGMVSCLTVDSRRPGTPVDSTRTWRLMPQGAGHLDTPALLDNCGTSSDLANYVAGISSGDGISTTGVYRFIGLDTYRANNITGQPQGSFSVPGWRRWRTPNMVDPWTFKYLGRTPAGTLPSADVPFPHSNPPADPLEGIDPRRRLPGVPSSPFPPFIPWPVLPALRNVPGIRDRWSPSTPKPPLPPVNPSRPKPGEPELKRRWRGLPALAAAKSGIRGAGEACDAIKAVWDALPGHLKWVPGKPQACGEQAVAIFKHWRKINWPDALANLAANHFTDKAVGGIIGATEDAYRKATGLPGWRTGGSIPRF